jgi:hypothetical protein
LWAKRRQEQVEGQRLRNLEGLDLKTGLRVSLAAHLSLKGLKPYAMRRDVYPDSLDPADAIKKFFKNHGLKIQAEKKRISALIRDEQRIKAEQLRTRLATELAR